MLVIDLHKMRPYWKPLGIAGFTALMMVSPHEALAAGFVKGSIRAKAQPIIEMLSEAAEPIGQGMYVWAAIKFILGHKADSKDMAKGATYGLIAIKLVPWWLNLLNSVGVE
jgi:hypothetical protein